MPKTAAELLALADDELLKESGAEKLDMNTATALRDKAVKKFGATKFRNAMRKVAMAQTKTEPPTKFTQLQFGANWFSVYAQPRHYIIAAMLAEGAKE